MLILDPRKLILPNLADIETLETRATTLPGASIPIKVMNDSVTVQKPCSACVRSNDSRAKFCGYCGVQLVL